MKIAMDGGEIEVDLFQLVEDYQSGIRVFLAMMSKEVNDRALALSTDAFLDSLEKGEGPNIASNRAAEAYFRADSE